MPANSLGVISVIVHIDKAASYTFSPQDTTALVTNIPFPGGTTLHMPDKAQSGDRFEFCTDSSCGGTTPLVLDAPPGTTIDGGASVSFVEPFSSAAAVFEENTQTWSVASKSSAAAVSGLNLLDNGAGAPVLLGGPMTDVVTIGPVTFLKGSTIYVSGTINAASPTVNASGTLSAQVLLDGGVMLRGGNSPLIDVAPPAGVAPQASIMTQFQFFVAAGAHTFKLQAASTVANMSALGGAPGSELSIFVFGPTA
jgi:hypothetical protein